MEQYRPVKKRRIVLAVVVSLILLGAAIFLVQLLGTVLERRSYRLVYPEDIAACAAEYELDPYLVAAVIHCESSNRPEAVSSAGAIGLMQIMPTTGEWIAGKLKVKDYQEEQLKTPQMNIRFGCWYLRFLLNRYEGNLAHTLAAYNAGHGNVDKWLQDPEVTEDGELKHIPFPQTEEYVPKVQRAHDKYETLYPDAFQ